MLFFRWIYAKKRKKRENEGVYTMKYTGTKRALEPKGSLTVTAWKVDNRKELQSRELRVAIDCISMERDSLLQICSICEYDEEKIKEKIYKIIGERGKLHNPYTESGGLFSGIVEEIGLSRRTRAEARRPCGQHDHPDGTAMLSGIHREH